MIALCLRLVPDVDIRLVDHFRQALGDYTGGSRPVAMRVREPWEAVRTITSPATRRALLWATLWYFAMPTDMTLWPTWLRRGDRYGPRLTMDVPSRDNPRYYGSMEALIGQCVLLSNPARRRNRAPKSSDERTIEWLSRAERELARRFHVVPF